MGFLNEPPHIQTNSFPCSDLIFTDQPNLSVTTGAHASLHPNCHHNIVPLPYQRKIWDHKKTDSTNIRKVPNSENWAKLSHQKEINAQVLLLKKTILNAFLNFVPSKYYC